MPDKFDLTNEQRIFLRKIARKNWAFFKTFVGQEDNWLPIDNFQEYPEAKIAHRTSPTDIGLGLLASLSAHDFGYITSSRFIERITNTFNTLDLLERYRGHFYSWYHTQSLQPLKPDYVSTVDSGNLAACLLMLRVALRTLADKSIIDLTLFTGLEDTLTVLNENIAGLEINSLIDQFQINLQSASHSLPNLKKARTYLEELTKCAQQILASIDETVSSEAHWWAQALCDECSDILSELDFFIPWLSMLPVPNIFCNYAHQDQIFTMRYLADFESPSKDLEALVAVSRQRAKAQISALEQLSLRCTQFANMEYEFLFDNERVLLSIGYNTSENKLDSARYDLLASEVRLTYFIAIAQGQIPKESWFALGRNFTVIDGQHVLLSWGGSMLEYLMPLLVMPFFEHTLLSQTYKSAVKRQIEYGEQRGVPWGISPSCYNSVDANHNYQYAPFGVPGLGLRSGLADNLVIAPHASALALMVAPEAALQNLQKLSSQGFIGKYGFYEAVDYTPARVPSGQSHVIVQSFMAHHQGMTLLSLSKLLLKRPMQELFETDPCFKDLISLLQEPISS